MFPRTLWGWVWRFIVAILLAAGCQYVFFLLGWEEEAVKTFSHLLPSFPVVIMPTLNFGCLLFASLAVVFGLPILFNRPRS